MLPHVLHDFICVPNIFCLINNIRWNQILSQDAAEILFFILSVAKLRPVVCTETSIFPWQVLFARVPGTGENILLTISVPFCVGVVCSGEYDACDVTLSVYPHRASLKNMPGHGGNRTYDLWNTSPTLCQLSYADRTVRVSDISEQNLVPSIPM